MGEVIEWVYSSNQLKNYIKCLLRSSMYKSSDFDDFMGFFIDQLLISDESKLIKAYKEGYILQYCKVIVRNQLISDSSPYFYYHKRKRSVDFDEYSYRIEDVVDTDIDQYDVEEYINRVKKILLQLNPIDVYRFKLYYFDGMNYPQISKYLGINWQVVRYSVIKIQKQIKNILDDEYYD